jgi:hypothetical protein
MDTGATNHLTSEMGKLSTQETYRGHDQVRTTNGACMHISHISQASLLTRNSQQLHLLNVLRVPECYSPLLLLRKNPPGSGQDLSLGARTSRDPASEDGAQWYKISSWQADGQHS